MITIDSSDTEVLSELTTRVWNAGLTENDVRELLGIRDVPLIMPQDLPSYLVRAMGDNSARALAICLFLLGQQVRRNQAEALLGARPVELLLRVGMLLETEPGVLACQGDLYPCLGVYVFTNALLARRYDPDHVYHLGTDSYALARATPRKRYGKALDLCTGSGIQAIMAAMHTHEVTGVDLNPRALEFAAFNARLNGVGERTRFVRGDLYEPIGDETFDLITSNPPFVPTPDKTMQRHRTGGETGEEISERLVAGLPKHLNPGGLFAMVLDYPVMRDSTYLERLQTWLGARQGWGVAVLNFGNVSCEHYIKQHIGESADFGSYQQQYVEYLKSYERLGIYEVGFANVYIQRLPEGHPGYGVERLMITPHHDQSKRISAWLEALEKYRDPAWEPDWDKWKPKLGPLVANLWTSQKERRGMIEFVDLQWSAPVALDKDHAELCSWLRGRQTAGQLAERWARRRKLSVAAARTWVKDMLRHLGELLVAC